ncbi:hypothetical protein VNO77_28661 [Canavalia gladiata]|uniref:Uncharacterized protein n=1 Tax=Canavalia gladiata TaxID=3824 RepID=A0AAN9KXG1_CANGL
MPSICMLYIYIYIYIFKKFEMGIILNQFCLFFNFVYYFGQCCHCSLLFSFTLFICSPFPLSLFASIFP